MTQKRSVNGIPSGHTTSHQTRLRGKTPVSLRVTILLRQTATKTARNQTSCQTPNRCFHSALSNRNVPAHRAPKTKRLALLGKSFCLGAGAHPREWSFLRGEPLNSLASSLVLLRGALLVLFSRHGEKSTPPSHVKNPTQAQTNPKPSPPSPKYKNSPHFHKIPLHFSPFFGIM